MDYAKILIVDDEEANLRLLQRIVGKAGYSRVHTTSRSGEVESLVSELDPDIILLDLQMPAPDGFAILARLKQTLPSATFLPILVLTADATAATKLRALSSGAHDFLCKPFDNAEVVQRVGNLLRTRRLHMQLEAQKEILEQTVVDRTRELEKALKLLRDSQQQTIQQERLHAFGTMASGVTHDFNNALSVILGFGEIALEKAEKRDDDDLKQCLRMIVTSARDGAHMVTRLREFYRPPGEEARAAVDLNELVQQAILITQPKWKSQSLGEGLAVTIETDLADIPPVSGEPAELREALTNLIFNAVDAMTYGGLITVQTRPHSSGVCVEVSDTGVGMTEEVRRHCLEPFFSTKGERGTGMGLAMVYGIVERHNGTMDIRSVPGIGTTFTFTLPAHSGDPEAAEASEPASMARPLNILVADDQPVLCEIVDEYLRRDCHSVETAVDGADAFRRFKAGDFDLVITDQAMPEMTGEQLATAIKGMSPATPVILLTGFGESRNGAEPHPSIDYVLSKPVSSIALRHAVVNAVTSR
jgi:signal transduction histidine kinase